MRLLTISFLILIGAAPATQPEIRRGLPHGPTTNPDERARVGFSRLIQRVEPSMKGDAARLNLYVDAFRHEFVEDPRLFAASFEAMHGDGRVVLSGFAEYDEHRKALERFLGQLGFDSIDNQIALLPDDSVKEQTVGFVSTDRSFVYDKTTTPRETVTECLRDEPVFLLRKTEDGYFLMHCADGYVGYVAADAIRIVGQAEFAARMAAFKSEATRQTVDRAIEIASKHLGVKYVWGGRSDQGLDCSGLVQTAFASQGINLPRDADQQSIMGKLVATRACRDGLRRGDLLFFLSRTGTVRHVAIYQGEQKFLQAEDGGVKISSFDPKDPAFDAKHDRGFCFAKRVIE